MKEEEDEVIAGIYPSMSFLLLLKIQMIKVIGYVKTRFEP